MKLRHKGSRGVAIWVVFCVCVVMGIFLWGMVTARMGVKRQSRYNFIQQQAHWLAQGAIQHALLKFRILPNESYEASALACGVCPFARSPSGGTVGGGDQSALEAFRLDVDTEYFGLEFNDVPHADYTVVQLRALNSFTEGNDRVHVVEIVAKGAAQGRLADDLVDFTDEVRKTVNVKRQLAP